MFTKIMYGMLNSQVTTPIIDSSLRTSFIVIMIIGRVVSYIGMKKVMKMCFSNKERTETHYRTIQLLCQQ